MGLVDFVCRDSVDTQYVSRSVFSHIGDNQDWNAFVHTQAVEWQKTVLGWTVNSAGHSVIVVKYEDMKTNTSKNSGECYTFCRFHTLRHSSRVLWQGGTDMFKRHHSPRDDFEHFTPEQESFVDSVVRTTLAKLEEVGLDDKCNVTSYLLHWFLFSYQLMLCFLWILNYVICCLHADNVIWTETCVYCIVVFYTIFAWRTPMKIIICACPPYYGTSRKIRMSIKYAWRCTIRCISCFDYWVDYRSGGIQVL